MACAASVSTPTVPAEENFSIDAFLARERAKDLLRFSTAGSVDDGKSTLIGRLLYDTQSVYDDQVRAIEGKGTAGPHLDFALLTDGLRAEREQGITIDVAYRYFSTAHRKFIIADTPGHEQYTRNMATGASTADAAIVLVDARKGVLRQSRRHAFIAALLGVQHILVAVNKMDLVGYDETAFASIRSDFSRFMTDVSKEVDRLPELHFIPVSALLGVNVAHRSPEMPWYQGPSLLELLESVQTSEDQASAAFSFPVQRVVRPDQHFRGFAGRIASGAIQVGDSITALPSGRASRVQRIVTWEGDLTAAQAPLSVTLTLEDELDISRGDVLFRSGEQPEETRHFAAALVWMDTRPLDTTRRYLLKHASRTVAATVRLQRHVPLDAVTGDDGAALEMNGIGMVAVETVRPLPLQRYADNRTMGAFVLIDAETHATAGAGMVRALHAAGVRPADGSPVTAAERARQWGHRGAVLRLVAVQPVVNALERALLHLGTCVIDGSSLDASAAALLADAGALVLLTEEAANDDESVQLRIGDAAGIAIAAADAAAAVKEILHALRRDSVLRQEEAR